MIIFTKKNKMGYEDEVLEQMRVMGELGFSLIEIIEMIKPEDPNQFEADFKNKSSDLRKAFKDGQEITDGNLEKSQYRAAIEGDLDKVRAFDFIRRKKKSEKVKQQLFGLWKLD